MTGDNRRLADLVARFERAVRTTRARAARRNQPPPPTPTPPEPDPVLRPRTVDPARRGGATGSAVTARVIEPRTVGAFGRPDPIAIPPPLESFADPTWHPPTGPVPVVDLGPPNDLDGSGDLDPSRGLGSSGDHDPSTATPTAVDDTARARARLERWVDEGSARVVVDHPADLDELWVDDDLDLAGARSSATPRVDEHPPASTTAAPNRMLRNNLFVASGTAASRITGLIRTSLVFGLLAKSLADTYVNANVTPNMIYELILGGVLTATLVPLFTDDLEKGNRGEATSAIISFAIVALVGVALLAAVVSPLLMLLFSVGSPDVEQADYIAAGVPLALLFAPQVFFYGLMAVWSAVLNSRHRFLAAAWAPVLNNLITIATLVTVWQMASDKPSLVDALADRKILLVLGIGTTTGIAIMAFSLYPSIRRADIGFKFHFTLKHPAVRRALRLSGWTFGYVVANQLALIVITILSKPGSGGSVSYQTAFQFFQLPHGLLAVSIMVTFEPLLGRADARADREGFNKQVLLGFRLIGLLIIPAAVGYIALPKGLDYRSFVATGELARAFGLTGIVAAFAVGLPAFSSYLFTLRAFYAMKDTRTPFLVNCFENAVNIVVAVVLVRIWGIVGLALSFAVAYTLAAVVAVVLLSRKSPGFNWRALVRTWVELLVAAALMGGVVFALLVLASPASLGVAVPVVFGAILAGIIVYLVTIWVLRVAGISELFDRLPVLRRFGSSS